MVDVMTIAAFYRWAMYATTWRLFICMCLFYSVRAIIQQIFLVEIPEGYNWAYPGVLSIFVPYGETSDFFYSGHVGVCMI